MKTLIAISEQYNIPKTTLYSRIIKNKLTVLKEKRNLFINYEQEKLIILPIQRQYKGTINRNIDKGLVWQFKIDNPMLSNSEIAQSLAINYIDVDLILMNDVLILESKINNRLDFRSLNII